MALGVDGSEIFRGHPEPKNHDYKTGWSASGTLAIVSATNPDPQAGVSLQVNFGEKDAQYYTLQFSISPPIEGFDAGLDTGICIKSIAEISWTVEGNTIRRLVGVSNGSSISGLGQACTIRIYDDSVNVSGVRNKTYIASVQVTRGTRPALGGGQPPLYAPRDVLIPDATPMPPPYTMPTGTTLEMPVPEDGGMNCVFIAVTGDTGPIVSENVRVEQAANGVTLYIGDLNSCNQFIPLVPGATEVIVTNSHADNIYVTPVYGVEG